MKVSFILLFCLSFLHAQIKTVNIAPPLKENHFMQIKILDQKYLDLKTVAGKHFSEISDLAYDTKAKRLFMLSDKGKLFTFEASFSDKITILNPIAATKLKKSNNKALRKWQRDSEGMTLGLHGGLLISFEGTAKVALFDYDGKERRNYTLPYVLRNPKNYRSYNKSLEALARHPKYGTLTVSEWPLKKDDIKFQTIYSLSGKKWHFRAEPEGNSATTAIEMMDDGNLLVLERSFTGFLHPFVITLKKVYLSTCKEGTLCKSEVLAKMSSHQGWSIDNFEGLTRIGKNRYLMISDDNDNFFERTLLIYFEVLE